MAWLSDSNSGAIVSTIAATSFFSGCRGMGVLAWRSAIIDSLRALCEGRAMTEFATASDGVRIAWERLGEGPPVVLVHGFGSNRIQNWRAPGWYDTLATAGYSVIALDNRGHGESDKPHEASAYS